MHAPRSRWDQCPWTHWFEFADTGAGISMRFFLVLFSSPLLFFTMYIYICMRFASFRSLHGYVVFPYFPPRSLGRSF